MERATVSPLSIDPPIATLWREVHDLHGTIFSLILCSFACGKPSFLLDLLAGLHSSLRVSCLASSLCLTKTAHPFLFYRQAPPMQFKDIGPVVSGENSTNIHIHLLRSLLETWDLESLFHLYSTWTGIFTSLLYAFRERRTWNSKRTLTRTFHKKPRNDIQNANPARTPNTIEIWIRTGYMITPSALATPRMISRLAEL